MKKKTRLSLLKLQLKPKIWKKKKQKAMMLEFFSSLSLDCVAVGFVFRVERGSLWIFISCT